MFGKSGNSEYKSKQDFKTAKDYLKYMYGSINGFIARMVLSNDDKNKQRLFKADKLISGAYEGLPEIYTSMNSFMTGKSRKINNLFRLNALFVDIDCYKMNLTAEQVISLLEQDKYTSIIPRPTFIIKSGRGLYLVWKLHKGDDRRAIERWKKVQKHLCGKLAELGADQNALDAARILRVPYTVNSKSGKAVEIAEFSDVQYTLYEIIKEYDICDKSGKSKQAWGKATARMKKCAMEIANEQTIEPPDLTSYDDTFEFIGKFAQRGFKAGNKSKTDKKATPKMIKYATKIAERKGLEPPDFADHRATWDFIATHRNKPFHKNNTEQSQFEYGQSSIHSSYLIKWSEDIAKLIKSRTGENCQRELCLFLHRLWLCEATRDFEDALQKTLELNAELNTPFSESYVRSHTHSAETKIIQGETYKYKKNSIIELLKITDDEMKQLDCLTNISSRERKQAKNRKAYEKRLQDAGKKPKSEAITIRREKIAKLINEGKTRDEIREELKISTPTYYRDYAILIADGLIKRGLKTVKAVKRTANRITDSIVNTIKEIADNMKGLLEIHKKEVNLEHGILKQIKKVRKNC